MRLLAPCRVGFSTASTVLSQLNWATRWWTLLSQFAYECQPGRPEAYRLGLHSAYSPRASPQPVHLGYILNSSSSVWHWEPEGALALSQIQVGEEVSDLGGEFWEYLAAVNDLLFAEFRDATGRGIHSHGTTGESRQSTPAGRPNENTRSACGTFLLWYCQG